MRNSFFVVALLLMHQILVGQVHRYTALSKRPVQYEKSEWNIELTGLWNNPYLQEEVKLDMHLVSPSGKKLVLPCYYLSGESGGLSLWRARFAPQEKGRYQYRFIFSQKDGKSSSSSTGYFVSIPSDKDGIMHSKDNWVFQFDSGKPFRGIGENIGWESRANDDSKFFKELHELPKYNYEYMLPRLAGAGGNYFRTWISSFNLPIDWKKGFNSNRYTETEEYYNPSAIEKLDRLVQLCDSLQLYMMLTLGQGAYHIRNGGYATSVADFFVNPQAKQQYRNRLRYFVARWGYSPSIGAWEFFNEVDNVQYSNRNNPVNGDDITQWHDEMSTYLKNLDPYDHIITTSISHRDIKGLNALPNIDLNQKHIYRNTSNMPAEIVRYTTEFGKPYVIGEYSYEWDWSKDFNMFADSMDSDFKRGLWYGLFSPTPILPLSWWWEFFEDRGTDQYLSKVRTILDKMLNAGKGSFKPLAISDTVGYVRAYAVQCGKEVFVYLYNPTSQLIQASFALALEGQPTVNSTIYDPETATWKNMTSPKINVRSIRFSGVELPAGADRIIVMGTKN